ncbi:hypothetical protein GCM10028821_45980 [Hymenobacter jeollabukensis]
MYEAPEELIDGDLRTVVTSISKAFAIDKEAAFATFADPQEHVKYFEIIKSTTPLIPMEGVLEANQYYVFEHVQEERLPPRMMLIRYTLNPPNSILKEAIADPFNELDPLADKKKGRVEIDFRDLGRNSTEITCRSTFVTNNGPVFVRGFIDHVWLNFYERLMVETGEISKDDMLTGV